MITLKHKQEDYNILNSSRLETPIGSMIAVGDQKALYLLEFIDGRGLARELDHLQTTLKATIIPGTAPSITAIEIELKAYFQGTLKEFKTACHLLGTPFQKQVWQELMQIPYGKTRSYKEQADAIGKQTACRAVANANGANQIAIVIPCHRIINSNGDLGGYGGGLARKKWLINHERKQTLLC